MSRVKAPNISVIMSVFNGGSYIARALLSILAQTYDDFEVILIEDGSTDHTAEVISKIRDGRVKLIHQENSGLTKSLNRALELSRGKWIARHDADDFSISTRFEQQIDFLNKNPSVGFLGSNCFIQPESHGIINEIYDYPELNDEIKAAFPFYNPFVHGSTIIRRDLLVDNSGYDESYRYVQDYELWSRILPKSDVHNLSTPLYVRSVHASTSQVTIDKTPIFNEIRDKYLGRVGETVNVNAEDIRQINSLSVYPILHSVKYWNKSISDTLIKVSNLSKKFSLPWLKFRAQAFLYCPWRF